MAPNATTAKLESIAWLTSDLMAARNRYYAVQRSALAGLVLSLVMLALFVYGMADYLVSFPRLIRLLLSLALVAGSVVVMRRLIRRFMRRLDDPELVARQIETVKDRKGQSLRSLLICALQFGSRPRIPGSVELKNETIRLARKRCPAPAAVPIYDKKLVRHSIQSVSISLGIYIVWLAFFFPTAKVFARRAMAFDTRYPTATRVVQVDHMADAPVRVEYPITVLAEGRLPASGRVTVDYKGEKNFTVTLHQDKDNDYVYRAMISKPRKSFVFKVFLGDYVTDDYAVTIRVPPFIKESELEVTPPGYTGREPLQYSLKNVNTPIGSEIRFRIRPNRDIVACDLLVGDRPPLELTAAEDVYVGAMRVTASMPFSVRLTDDRGLENTERVTYFINAVSDQPPVVRLVEPRAGVYRSKLSTLAFLIDVRDDYGVDKAGIGYRIFRPYKEGEETKEKDVQSGEIPVELAKSGQTASGRLSRLVNSFAAQEGDRIAFWAVASDNRPEKPQQAKSDEVSVFLVSPTALRGIIGKDQKRIVDLVKKLRDEEERQAQAIEDRMLNL